MESKQGRYPKDHPRSGGYVVFWAKQTLESSKFKDPRILGLLVKVVCVAQLVDFTTGTFEKAGMAFDALTIASRAGITGEQFNTLVIMDLIIKKAVNGKVVYSVKSWEEHQNPKHQSSLNELSKEVPKEVPKKSQYPYHQASSIKHHSTSIKSKYDSKSKKIEV